LKEIESAEVSQIVDSSSAELLDELDRKRRKVRLWPVCLGVLLVVLFIANSSKWPGWSLVIVIALGITAVYFIWLHDVREKTVIMLYDLEGEFGEAYSSLLSDVEYIASCSKIWHIASAGRVLDKKYHAGANEIVNRKVTVVKKAPPPYVTTNVDVYSIGVGRQTMYFLPDRVLIYDYNGVGAVNYKDFVINVAEVGFVEEESIPHDSQIVATTWKYVNKSGGPDRRFKDNRELPICRYEKIHFSSDSGVNEVIQISKCGLGRELASSAAHLGNLLPV
jgi:hypothetical protein